MDHSEIEFGYLNIKKIKNIRYTYTVFYIIENRIPVKTINYTISTSFLCLTDSTSSYKQV